jgi:hypothetical protein
LIDIMPTFADVTESTIPLEFDGRDLRPVSGQSLRPILQGESITREQPIHFLFASDRGLRDGDWKAVSFRSETWELYNIADDRTEVKNLSDRYPDRLSGLVDKWTTMAHDVLHAPSRSYASVSAAKLPHEHLEWTNFASDPVDGVHGGMGAEKSPPRKNRTRIRARKNTELEIVDGLLRLTFSGEDSGLAFESLPQTLAAGPYAMTFDLRSDAEGDGDLFFTTDAKTSLPKGERVSFPVVRNRKWHEHRIEIETAERLHKLRLDVGEGNGTAMIRNLRLIDVNGEVLLSWPM